MSEGVVRRCCFPERSNVCDGKEGQGSKVIAGVMGDEAKDMDMSKVDDEYSDYQVPDDLMW